MKIEIVILLIWLHFCADFLLQNDYIARRKSEDNGVLLFHVLIYSWTFIFMGLTFCCVTFITHFIIDYVSSRVAKYYYAKDNRHSFFVTIGVDQALHISQLMITYYVLLN